MTFRNCVNKALIDGAVERAQKRIPDDVDVFEYVLTNPGTTMVHLLDGPDCYQ